jgi:hypothetical protein
MSDLLNVPQFDIYSNRKEKGMYLLKLSERYSENELMKHFDLTPYQYNSYLLKARKSLGLFVSQKQKQSAKYKSKNFRKIENLKDISSLTRKEQGLYIQELRKTYKPNEILFNLNLTRAQYSSLLVSLKPKKSKSYLKVLEIRIKNFQTKAPFSQVITVEEFINKFGNNPICYLTGKILDITKPESYVLDHLVPVSKDGSGDIENMKPCDPLANTMKWNTEYEDFIKLCKQIVEYNS